MKARLADALWDCLAELPVGEISVGDVIEAAGVSRGSFYYHFDDLDELLAWAIRQEVMNSDRKGHSFALLLARTEPSGNALVQRAIARVCLLLDKGGMSPVFDVALDAMREVWVAVLEPEGGRLPDGVVAQLEYAVGGSVGMLARAFAGMTVALERNINELKASLARQHGYEGELNAAREIQEGMLPASGSTFDSPGFRAAALMNAAREVGGDFFDVFALPEGRKALLHVFDGGARVM